VRERERERERESEREREREKKKEVTEIWCTYFFNNVSFSAMVIVSACAMILSCADRASASAHALFSVSKRDER
jgi:uncharacterized membrane protein